jgi:adenine-specific DNA-methyltransferase
MAIPESKLAFQRHVRKLRGLGAEGLAPPEIIVSAVLYVWRKRFFPLLPGRAPQGAAPIAVSKEVGAFVGWLSERPFLDSAYWLATAYAILVSEEKRAKRALFFTPPILANRLIDQLVIGGANLRAGSWHDPACGGAAFLVPVALRMASSLAAGGMTVRQQLASISRRLSGNWYAPDSVDT